MVLGVNIKKAIMLEQDEIQEMYNLMCGYYENLSWSKFRKDIGGKNDVLLIKNEGRIHGFTTIELIPITVNGHEIIGVFSGDTIVDQSIPIGLELQQGFATYIKELLDLEQREVYWFLICKGYKTYRYLSIYFEEYYPNYEKPTPSYEKEIMDTYGFMKYGMDYDPQLGIVNNTGFNDYLKVGVAPIADKVLKNPVTQFFIERNPGHTTGDELVCLARFSNSNLKDAFFRVISQRL